MKITNIEILDYLRSNKEELRKEFGVIKIGLFGSYSRNEQNENSDIDIAIEIEKAKKSLKNFFAIKRTLEEQFGKKVDLGIESSLKPMVKEFVQKEIIYV